MLAENLVPQEAFERLAAGAEAADDEPRWPEPSWQILCDIGVRGRCLPRRFGGSELDGEALLEGYGRLAAACLTSCFLLSQRTPPAAVCATVAARNCVPNCCLLWPAATLSPRWDWPS